MTENDQRVMTDSFPCTGCGSQMIFDPDTQGMLCEHCGRRETISSPVIEAPEYLYNPNTDQYDAPDWDALGSRTVRCSGCGAQTVISAAVVTATCPFCGGNYVVDQSSETIGILPETIMPFRISRKKAFELFQKWVKSRFWAPDKFKKAHNTPEKLNGTYMPFWTFDAHLQTSYAGEGGEDYTVTRTRVVNGKTETYTETETRWFPISGEQVRDFDDERVCASKSVDGELLNGLGGFDTKMLNRYSPAFLAGFSAQRYDVGLGQGFGRAQSSMQSKMEAEIQSGLHYDHYRNMRYNHLFSNVKFKHILLPAWLSSYKYNNKVYRFFVNGETGRVSGKAPVSALKVLLAIMLTIAFIIGIYLLCQYVGIIRNPQRDYTLQAGLHNLLLGIYVKFPTVTNVFL